MIKNFRSTRINHKYVSILLEFITTSNCDVEKDDDGDGDECCEAMVA